MRSLQDTYRILMRGGLKKPLFGIISPIFGVPLMLTLAGFSKFCFFISFSISLLALIYLYVTLRPQWLAHNYFFFSWTVCSVISLLWIFEFNVPLLEILPEENYFLATFVCLALFFTFKTKAKSPLRSDFLSQDELFEDIETPADAENPDSCRNCRQNFVAKSFHSPVCQACIGQQEHHSFWLNCCISESNRKLYLLSLVLSLCALLLAANLILTSVCHPILVFNAFHIHILLPDDCSEVFEQYEFGISFAGAIYALLFAAYITFALILQIFLSIKGVTLSEWHKTKGRNRYFLSTGWRSVSSQ